MTDITAHGTSRKALDGFTLIELLVTLSVAGILLTVAVPSFNSVVMDSRLRAQANDVVATLNYARSEAIKRNGSISFCRTAQVDSTACVTSGGAWQHWIVRSAAGTVLRRGSVAASGNLVVSSTLTNDTAVFGSDGLVRTAGLLVSDHQIRICAPHGGSNNVRQVILGSGSRISTNITQSQC